MASANKFHTYSSNAIFFTQRVNFGIFENLSLYKSTNCCSLIPLMKNRFQMFNENFPQDMIFEQHVTQCSRNM